MSLNWECEYYACISQLISQIMALLYLVLVQTELTIIHMFCEYNNDGVINIDNLITIHKPK